MTLDEIRRINDRRLARYGQKYYTEDKVYIGNSDGSLSLVIKDVQNQYNPTAGSGISISGTFPNQTISNTLPDQTVALTAGTGISVAGTYPSFTITNTAAGYSILRGVTTGIDTYTTTITGVTSYVDGDAYLIRFTNGNTVASPTLNINGIGAIPLYRNNDGQLIGGDIVDGAEMLCVYNSTLNAFQCIGTSPNTLFAYVTNGDSVSITKGQPVYAFGGTGDRMVVKRAANTSDSTSARTVGLVYSTSIGVNQKGLIITEGLLDGLTIVPPSSGWADGDIVYLGATAGTITRTKPYAPNHLVYLGVVTTASNGSAGRIQVTVQNGYELNEIHDVDVISTPAVNNDVLTYVAGSPNLWKPRSISTILGYTPLADTAWIDYSATSTITGWASFTLKQLKYKIVGNMMFVNYALYGISNANTTSFTLPNNAIVQTENPNRSQNNGVWYHGFGIILPASNLVTFNYWQLVTSYTPTWTALGSKVVSGQICFEI